MSDKCPSEYLNSDVLVETVQSTVKGVNFGSADNSMVAKEKLLVFTMQKHLDLHISDPTRVHKSRRHYYTIDFDRGNFPAMAATMCFSDHIVDDLESFRVDECLLAHPNDSDGLRSFANEPAACELSNVLNFLNFFEFFCIICINSRAFLHVYYPDLESRGPHLLPIPCRS